MPPIQGSAAVLKLAGKPLTSTSSKQMRPLPTCSSSSKGLYVMKGAGGQSSSDGAQQGSSESGKETGVYDPGERKQTTLHSDKFDSFIT
jgi:hypothetical protein